MRVEYRPPGKENRDQRRSIRNSTPVQQLLRLLGRQPEPPPEQEIKMSMDRSEFVKDESSGVPLNEHLEPQEGVEGREVNFSPEMYAQYENFLYNYTMKLAKLKKTPPPPGVHPAGTESMFDLIIGGSPTGEIDRQFYEQIIGNNGKPDEDKIAKFLETAEGWMLTTGMMEQQRALTIFAMGLDTAARSTTDALRHADRGTTFMGRQIVRLGRGQGALNRMWNNAGPAQRWGIVGAGVLGLGAAAVGTPIGAAVAAAVGGNAAIGAIAGGVANVAAAEAGAGAIVGVLTGIQRGDYVDVHECKAAWEYINRDPALRLRLQYMSGLDTRDYHVNGAGHLEIAPGRMPQSVRLEENLRTAMSLGFSAEQFYESLGIDPGLMDSSREQFITHGMAAHEQGTTYLEERTMQLLDANNPASGWNAIGIGIEDRIQLYHEAKRKAMLEMFNTVTDKLREEQTDARLETAVEEIDRKISALSEGGEAEQKIREPLNKEKAMLSEVNEGINGRNGVRVDAQTMENYNQALQAVTEARDRLHDILETSEIEAINREINLRNSVTTERLHQLRQELANVEGQLQAQLAAGEAIDNRLDASASSYDRLINIDAQLIAQGLPAVGLDTNVLRSQSVEEIIRRINQAHASWGARVPPLSEVWPANENMSPIHRTGLYLMIAEAQAQETNAVALPSPNLQLCRATNISENFLRTSTPEQIIEHFRTIPVLNGIAANRNEVVRLINEAQTRFTARTNAFKEVVKREEYERNEFNATLGVQRTQLDTDIARDRNEMATLETEERALNSLRNLDTQSKAIFSAIENDYMNAYNRVANKQAQLAALGTPVPGLEPTAIAGYDPAQLRAVLTDPAINIPLPADPAAAERFLISVISEAQARRDGGTGFLDEPAGVTFAATLGISEQQVRDWTDQNIFDYMDRNRIPRNSMNADQLREIRAARAELQARRDARTNALLTNIRANPGVETSFLRTIPEFIKAENAFNTHLTNLGISKADLQNRIATNEAARASLRELSNQVSTMLAAIESEETTYGTALRNAQTVRNQTAIQLNGVNSIVQLDRLINLPVDELQRLRTTIVNNEQIIRNGQAVEQYYTNAREMYTSLVFDANVTALYAPGRELNDAALRTLSLQELLTRMNEVHAAGAVAGPPVDVGWPPEDNDLPENRIRLVRAVEEARWRALNGPGNIDFNGTILGSGTPEHILLSMTPQEAIAEINRRAGALLLNPALPADIARVEAFKTIAQNRLNNRTQAMNSIIDSNNGRIRAIDRTLAQPDTGIGERRQRLIEMRNSIVNRGERMSAMNLFAARPRELDLMAPIGAEPDLTAAENAAQDALGNPLPRAMIEMYQIMFNYRQRPDRQDAFQAILQNLPPQQFIDTFVTQIPVLAVGGPPPDVADFITRLRDAIDNRRVTSHELRRVISAISTNFEGRALAMAA